MILAQAEINFACAERNSAQVKMSFAYAIMNIAYAKMITACAESGCTIHVIPAKAGISAGRHDQ
jgi:hypothetical protein